MAYGPKSKTFSPKTSKSSKSKPGHKSDHLKPHKKKGK